MKQLKLKNLYPIILGFIALCWFLIRVIPKPSRATYPCQRAAFPLATAFVIWLTGIFSSTLFFLKFKKNLKANKLGYAFIFFVLAGFTILIYTSVIPSKSIFAKNSIEYVKADWNNSRITQDIITTFDEVAIVKSAQANATDIEYTEIEELVRASIEMAGGINDIISNGDYVVLKPNLVEAPPEPGYNEVGGIATDWRVVKAVATIVRELNPDGKVYIIESSSATSTREILEYYNYTLENIPEVDAIVALEDSCGAYEDYSDINLEALFLPDSIRLYPDEEKPNVSPEFYISKIYNNADIVISIPVLKNHKTAIITSGIKNVAIGMAPPNIYGMSETFFGKWTKIDHSFENLNKWIHDYYLCKPVDFVIVDGLQGFDHGPTGIPDLSMVEMQHNMRLIISGKKALSVDAVCGHIMSLDPEFANYMVYLNNEDYHVGTIDSRLIRVKGEQLNDIREVFQHNTEITTNAINNDHTPPVIEVISNSIIDNTITLQLDFDNDLNKIEVEVNGILLDQVCINNFASITFEIIEDMLPVNSVKLYAFDRFFNVDQVIIDISSIKERKNVNATLYQNFPNPFSNSTQFSFSLIRAANVNLFISDQYGNKIGTVVRQYLNAGKYAYNWSGDIARGTYFFTLEVDGEKLTKRMIKN